MVVTLRKLKLEDAKPLVKLIGDKETLNDLGGLFTLDQITEEFEANWIQMNLDNYKLEYPSELSYAIINESGIHVGNAGFSEIDPEKKVAEAGYFIGKNFQGNGYATSALAELINIARIMGLSKLKAGAFEYNKGSRRVLEKNGFQLIEIKPGNRECYGEFYDDCFYELDL